MKRQIRVRALMIGVYSLVMIFAWIRFPLVAADKDNINAIVAGNNAFACSLYLELAKDKGNLFFSPYSISSALAMTYAGARGETARQMSEALHFSLAPEKLHPAFADMQKAINTGGKGYELAVANALWGQAGYNYQPEFLNIINKYYGAGFKPVEYTDDRKREQTRRKINRWVEGKTRRKIKDLIKPDILNALTRLVLTNAIYFKGQWESQFKLKDTQNMPFYVRAGEVKQVPMMFQKAKFHYLADDQAQIIELPYKGGDLAMAIVLPRPEIGLEALEASLTPEKVQNWLSGLAQAEVKVYLPRFRLEQSFTLNDPLKSLGMNDAFDMLKADFSGMTSVNRLYITNAIHKAFVEVNEAGTEASAATAIIMGVKALKPEAIFRADRPFLFMIRDRRTGSILFMGRLAEPR